MKISFLGAAREVTGSNFLVETKNEKFLIDCGMFQGKKELEELNKEDFKFNPNEIDFVILSHAHIDHSGRLPLLYKRGYSNPIYATKPTVDLCEVMLQDSARIQQADVEWENRKRTRAGKPKVEPLYNENDAKNVMRLFQGCYYDDIMKINENVSVRFRDAGHILGSSCLELWIKEGDETTKIVYSGDLGMPDKPILKNPEFINTADYVIVESTYGNRTHPEYEYSVQRLIEIIDKVTNRGGTVIIPSFAVGRTQEIIYDLNSHYDSAEKIEYHNRVPIYIDSPLAVRATEAFTKNSYFFNDVARDLIKSGDNIFEFENLKYISDVEESITLNKVKFPRVIISSSGMATAGRVRHHLKHNLWDEKNAVVFVGYQSEGSLGRILLDGVKDVKILGEDIKVNAEIYDLDGFSGHADKDMLYEWMKNFEGKPKVFVVHGEEKAQIEFKDRLEEGLGLECTIPKLNEEFVLQPGRESIDTAYENVKNSFEIESEVDELIKNLGNIKNRDFINDLKNMSGDEYSDVRRKIYNIKNEIMNIYNDFSEEKEAEKIKK
ncbi:MBL fold metallo-hydrolase RNA specificity domain-containing protein [Lagierella massiliensis]|uniref:MBL fold metallo-hydrolase RNA specificity domain-containing protein n=1 Tax=Lagierella massiliensis TaxID=1689303 RepID=UPI0006D7697C|nr:MBL fold metallo-hydrolase [Lagierella massiliensis]